MMMKRLLIPILLIVFLASCRLPSVVPQVPGAQSGTPATVPAPGQTGLVLKVRIQEPFSVQAKPEEIANGATIALVDSETGMTLGTSVTSPTGEYILNFGENVSLVDGRAYYLDVIKGLRLDTSKPLPPPHDPLNPFNQAGADALRLRNILFYQAGTALAPAGWKSLYNVEAGNTIDVGNKSTALAVALALKKLAGEAIVLSDYIGVLKVIENEKSIIELDPNWALGGMDHNGFTTAYTVVKTAIDSDRDPLQYTSYDQTNRVFRTTWVGFSMGTITPLSGPINQVITITGFGFSAGVPQVTINGLAATVTSFTDTEIKARVNPGTRTGPVAVKIGSNLLAGNTFAVTFVDGHQAVLDRVVGGKTVPTLYVANPTWNTVVEVLPDGSVKKIWDDLLIPELKAPQQIVVRNNKVYVSCNPEPPFQDLILELDPASPATKKIYSTSVPSPSGMAFDSAGALHVASYEEVGKIYKLNSSGLVVGTPYGGVSYPRGIAFDYQGSIFVAEEQGKVTKLAAPGMAATLMGLIPSPLGVAVDSAGDAYVASNVNNAIFRITASRAMSVFAMVNKPGGLTFDSRGNMFVSDTERNVVSRIAPTGDSRIYAYGISNPRGLAVDPADGTLYVSLSQSNAILKVKDQVLKPFVTGIANPMTINFRGNGLIIAHPETDNVSFADRDGNLQTLATGVDFTGGADQAAVGNTLTGPLYAGRFGDRDDPRASWPPRYDANSGQVGNGGLTGLSVIDNGIATHRPWLYRQNLNYIAVDAQKNIYAVSVGDRTLTKISVAPGGGNSSRRIQRLCGPRAPNNYTFAADPGWVSVDTSGNVYVVVTEEDAIYRFKPSGATYVMDKIKGTGATAFNKPWGIAFSDTPTPAMFVSNTGDGIIRRVVNPAIDAAPQSTATFNIQVATTVKGLAYKPTTAGTGTGTLYMANGSSVMQAGLNGNAPVALSYKPYIEDLPVAWSYLYVHPGNGYLYGWGNSTFSYYLKPGTPPVLYTYQDYTGWSRYLGFTFAPDGTYYGIETFQVGLSYMRMQNTTREVLLNGNNLYVASPDNRGSGGVLRINLTTNEELMIPIQSYSLGISGTDLYVGATDKKIYKVDTNGLHTAVWTLPALPYGLDVYNGRVWTVGHDSVIYERVIAGGEGEHRFGMMGPVF
jgi:sugar lactone lactonase YvrE